jgi:uncharacterized membrane protein
LAALAVESFADLGVEAPLVALGVLVNLILIVVFGFLTESVFGESYFSSAGASSIWC